MSDMLAVQEAPKGEEWSVWIVEPSLTGGRRAHPGCLEPGPVLVEPFSTRVTEVLEPVAERGFESAPVVLELAASLTLAKREAMSVRVSLDVSAGSRQLAKLIEGHQA